MGLKDISINKKHISKFRIDSNLNNNLNTIPESVKPTAEDVIYSNFVTKNPLIKLLAESFGLLNPITGNDIKFITGDLYSSAPKPTKHC
ncbi:hypothetical protein OBK28_12095 [Empedobacter falsenii]